jgi:EAL domain-containing protein (putative c-di-GMP-specific phosphodiesterase class I)
MRLGADGQRSGDGKRMKPDQAPSGALCFVVDDEPAIGRFIALAVRNFGGTVEQFLDLASMNAALAERTPQVIFLDVSLGATDAIDAIRQLAAQTYPGVVQLMSGRDAMLLEDVKLIGERHGLHMRPALTKPFRVDAIKRVIDEERLRSSAPSEDALELGQSDDGVSWPKVSLREALDRGWVELWYQPKVDLHGPDLSGAEGLARVRHPEHGILPPAAFLSDASGPELIDLAEFTLRTALRDAAEFADSGHPMRLAINVPVEALVRLPIAAIVAESFPRADQHRTGIILEVTEDQVIRDIPKAHEIATQLRIHGISLALDDFGSGYSSLARIKDLPFAELKLDRSFVTGCGLDPAKAAICQMATDLSHRFGCLAVAEGVETVDDLGAVRRLGCDVAQGFLFARAMPKDSLRARLEANGNSGGFTALLAANIGDDFRAIA